MPKEIDGLYNWTKHEGHLTPVRPASEMVEIDDETLRDGMQGTHTAYHPRLERKYEYLREAASNGFIEHADVGMPINGPLHRSGMIEIINSLRQDGVSISFSAAGRGGKKDDLVSILEVADKTGELLEADLFLDTSKLRHSIEGWNRAEMIKDLKTNIEIAKKHNLPVMFVPERASVTPPEELDEVLLMAADLGIDRIAIADTTGVLTPHGTSMIFRHVLKQIGSSYPDIKWDFHEHNDLGMGIANCIVAANEGVERMHATSRGVGERTGNVELEQLLVVLNLQGFRGDQDTTQMQKFAQLAADILSVPILPHEPIVGPEWPESGSGIHASTMSKNPRIYLPFDPAEVGLETHIKIGPMSSLANVYAFCEEHNINDVTEERAREILDSAKLRGGILTYDDVKSIVGRNGDF